MSDEALAALERVIADTCLKVDAGERIATDLASWLAEHGVAEEDARAILAAPPRLGVYRSLVRNGLSAVVLQMLPRTRARMNAATPPARFDRDLAAFVDTVAPRTHYLRDVPREFFAWAEPRWRADAEVLPYLPDLAAFELAGFAVGASPAARDGSPAEDLALDRPLAFHASTRLLRLAWAVHELGDDETREPAARPVQLLGTRDAAHAVRWLELTPLAADVVDRLLAGAALGEAVTAACAAHATAVPVVLADVARLLADLGVRGVLLGAR
ncbi:MAG TPA: putative DNA-binding domain-containing protein [Polyangiaceae bacterium]|jgi:hypothetical protein